MDRFGFEAGASARFAGRSHDSDWRTTAEAPGGPVLRTIALGVALVIAAVHGGSMMVECRRSRCIGMRLPQAGRRLRSDFGKPLNFFLLHCPPAAHRRLLLTLLYYLCAGRFFILITGGSRALSGRLSRASPCPGAGCRSHSRFSGDSRGAVYAQPFELCW